MSRNDRILQALNAYLMERYNCETESAHFGVGNDTIYARQEQFILYFRLPSKGGGFWGTDTFVVAQMGFHETRKGYGRDLIQFLAKLVITDGFRFIGIEQTNELSSRFAEKFGFTPYKDDKNYIVPIDNLIDRFERV